MSRFKKIFVGLLVASSLLFVTPSTTEAARRVVVRGRYYTPYTNYGRYAYRPYRSYYRATPRYYSRGWGPVYYGNRSGVNTPWVSVWW